MSNPKLGNLRGYVQVSVPAMKEEPRGEWCHQERCTSPFYQKPLQVADFDRITREAAEEYVAQLRGKNPQIKFEAVWNGPAEI